MPVHWDQVCCLRFVGADPGATIAGTRELPGKSNYFIGADPGRWRVGVPNYSGVAVEGIYPGIDLIYYGHEGEMELDFVIAPRTDPGRIQIEIAGDHDFEVDEGGDLVIRNQAVSGAGGTFRLRRPHVVQSVDGAVRTVDGRYAVLARRPRRASSSSLPMTGIVPWSSIPRSHTRAASAGARTTTRRTLPSTAAATSTSRARRDPRTSRRPPARVQSCPAAGAKRTPSCLKLSGDGSTVLYSTFLGGTRPDQGMGIGLDYQNDAYVAGTTSFIDSGFPTTPGAYRTSPADFFIAKLDPQGDLVYSTFFGGSNIASLGGLAVHGTGDSARVYIVGSTVLGFPTTANAYRRDMSGPSDVFLSILEPAQAVPRDQLVYSTLFGGDSFDSGLAVAVGPNATAYITGTTVSGGLPLRHAFDSTHGGNREAFLAVFDPAKPGDDSLVYSTFIGGDRDENGTTADGGIAVGPSGVALVAGTTTSLDFPVTPEGIRVSRENSDGFFVAIDPSLPGRDSLRYGTYLGGSAADAVTHVAAGPPGIAYLTGYTLSTDMSDGDGGIATKFGVGPRGSGQDAFIAKIDWTRIGGASLIDAAYVGGTGSEFTRGIAADAFGNVYVAGYTTSEEPFLPSPGFGLQDGFVASLGTTIQLPDSVIGESSIDVLSAEFGTGPHTWSLLSGSPPDGLLLASDGTLSGRPAEAGSSTFTVEITDSLAATRQRTYRKRIGTGAGPGDVLIRKAGVTPVPGRILSLLHPAEEPI